MNHEWINSLLEKTKRCTLIAATKYFDISQMRELASLGITHFGENRVQDFLKKKIQLQDEAIVWHFIGHLQTNKVASMIDEIDVLHSLDSMKLAQVIQKTRKTPLDCFVEVNISNEASKAGIHPDNVVSMVHEFAKYDKIRIIGFMGLATHTSDQELIRSQFQQLLSLRDLVKQDFPSCVNLSMGMSNDFEIAMSMNATHLRLGRILFGNEG